MLFPYIDRNQQHLTNKQPLSCNKECNLRYHNVYMHNKILFRKHYGLRNQYFQHSIRQLRNYQIHTRNNHLTSKHILFPFHKELFLRKNLDSSLNNMLLQHNNHSCNLSQIIHNKRIFFPRNKGSYLFDQTEIDHSNMSMIYKIHNCRICQDIQNSIQRFLHKFHNFPQIHYILRNVRNNHNLTSHYSSLHNCNQPFVRSLKCLIDQNSHRYIFPLNNNILSKSRHHSQICSSNSIFVHNNRINPIHYKYKILCVYNNLRSSRNRVYSKCTCIYSKNS